MDWSSFLSHPVWQFTETVLAFVGTTVALWTFVIDRKKGKREITVYDLFRSTIFLAPRQPIDKLEITFDGQPAKSLRLLVAELKNTGQEPIQPDEIHSAIEFEFPEGAVVTRAEVTKVSPSDLSIGLIPVGRNRVQFSKALLNPNDSVTCEISLLNSDDFSFQALGRIVGVQKIPVKNPAALYESISQLLFSGMRFLVWLVLILLFIDMVILYLAPFWAPLVVFSLVTLGLVGYDKVAAYSGARRIPEVTWLALGLLGGGPGGLIGALVYRHKLARPSMRVIFVATTVWSVVLAYILYSIL